MHCGPWLLQPTPDVHAYCTLLGEGGPADEQQHAGDCNALLNLMHGSQHVCTPVVAGEWGGQLMKPLLVCHGRRVLAQPLTCWPAMPQTALCMAGSWTRWWS